MRKRRLVRAGLIVLLLAGAGAWWWGARRAPAPKVPPAVAISDPEIAAAVEDARAAVLAKPGDAARWGRLGQTYLANGLLAPARECLAEAGRLDPKNPRWPYLEAVSLLLSDPVAALPCWRRAAECPGDDDHAVTARLRWAEELIANGRGAEAEPVLRAVLAARPDSARAHFALGQLATARNDPQAGVAHFDRCAGDPCARRGAATHLATLYAAQGNASAAAAAARRAAELPPDRAWPDPFQADYAGLTVGREALFIQAEKQHLAGDVDQAIRLYQTVIQRYPNEARAHAKLGMILAELGQYAAAENVLRDGIAAAPNLVQCHFFLAAALFPQAERLGFATPAGRDKLHGTVAAARRATELKPDHGFAHLYLGLALRQLGQRAEGLTALREAVRCSPEATDPHLHLGLALWDENRPEEAVAELETAAALAAPTDARPRAALDRVRAGAPPKK